MSAAAIEPYQVFGLNQNVVNNCCFVDDNTVVYPAGTLLVVYNCETKEQKFIAGLEGCHGYSAMAVSANKRFVAVAEKRDVRPHVVVFDLHTLKRRKTLVNVESRKCTEYLYLSFSPDSKYLVLLGNEDFELLYWCWEKSRGLMGSTRVSADCDVHSITINPHDDTHMCAAGNGLLKTFRYADGNIKTLSQVKMANPANFLCQAWLTKTMVVAGTNQNTVMIYKGQELRAELRVSDDEDDSTTHVVSIVALSNARGFVCADALGKVHVFEQVVDEAASSAANAKVTKVKKLPPPNYVRTKTEVLPTDDANGAQHVTSLALSPSETDIIATTNKQQVYMIRLVPLEGDAALEEENANRIEGLFLLAQPYHHAAVVDVSMAVRRPLLATCSADGSVRVWDYVTGTMDIKRYFPETPHGIAMHPSGYQLLVGFADKLRLMSVRADDMAIVKEFVIRSCQTCAFSHGGAKFAAANGTTVELYNTFTFEACGVLRGHNNKVQDITWSNDDSKLTTCGADGGVYVWDVLTQGRVGENVLKTCAYTGVASSPDALHTYAVGNDGTLKEIADNAIINEIPSINKQCPQETVLTQVAVSKSGRLLVVATASGAVRAVKQPLTTPWEGTSLTAHVGAVKRMCISPDDHYLVSVGDDGCVVVYRLSDREGRGMKRHVSNFSQEVLIPKSELRDKNKLLTERAMQIRELQIFNNYQLELKEMGHTDVVKEMGHTYETEIEDLRVRVAELEALVSSNGNKHEAMVVRMAEDHTAALEELEVNHNKKLLAEYEKYTDLQRQAQDMEEKCERQLVDMEVAKAQALDDLAEFWKNKMAEKDSLLDATSEKARHQEREHLETRRQIEVDVDQEILSMKNLYEQRLKTEQENSLRLQGDNGILRKKFKSQARDIQDAKNQKEAMDSELKKLHTHIRALEKDVASGKKEISERDETIQDKEKRIYDLKKKNQELEKFKFVLDYKIKELKKQIEPREREIKEMQTQINHMDVELAKYYENNASLQLEIQELQAKLRAGTTEHKLALKKITTLEQRSKRFRADLHTTAQFCTEPKHLVGKVRRMFKTYCEEDQDFDSTVDEDVQREANRQREFLEQKAAGITSKLSLSRKMHEEDVTRIMKENQVLIREINSLRKELRSSKQESHNFEATLRTTLKLSEMRGTKLPDLTETMGASKTLRETMDAEGLEKIIHLQKNEIRKLRTTMTELESTQRDRPESYGKKLEPLST